MEVYLGPIVVLIGILVVLAIAAFGARRVSWQCADCKRITNPPLLPLLLAPKTKGQKYMRCPRCKRKALLRPVTKQKWV